jgi:hypothetical protein
MDERDGLETDERDNPEPAQLSQGASTDLGPRPGSGGEQEPQGLAPPYEGRQTEAKEGLDHMDKVFHRVDEVPPGPGRVISDKEREGVSSTDMDATSALGVGESMSRPGEDVAKQEDEPGREDTGTRRVSGRPAGVSDERDSSSVDPG